MRKITSFLIFALLLILVFPGFTYASGIKLTYDGKVHIYNEKPVTLYIEKNKINSSVPPVLLSGSTLVPARAVFEELGAEVKWNPTQKEVTVKNSSHNIVLKIDSKTVIIDGKSQSISLPAKIINGSTMIPLRFVSEGIGLDVKWNPDQRTILITQANIKQSQSQSTNKEDNVSNNQSGNVNNKDNSQTKESNVEPEINKISFNIQTNKTVVKIDATSSISTYSNWDDEKSLKLVVDIPNAIIDLDKYTIPVGDGKIVNIRAAQYQKNPNKVRVVFDLSQKPEYVIAYTDDKKSLLVTFNGASQSNTDTANSGNLSGKSDENQQTTELADLTTFNSKLGGENEVTLKEDDEKFTISISMTSSQKYKVSRLTDPDSVDIDIDKVDFDDKDFKVSIKNKTITALECSKVDKDTGRITVITPAQIPYQEYKESGKLEVYLFKKGYKNIRYENAGALSTIILSSADVSKNITINQNKKSGEYSISIPEKTVDTEPGVMNINDKMVEWLNIEKSGDSASNITVKLNTSSKVSYDIRNDSKDKIYIYFFARENLNISSGNILIAIDAGHGGKDPGAVYKDKNGVAKMQEKDVNLDIAKKLSNLLEESGIPTIMTRDKDEYVELHKRTDLANEMKADLFVSIHSNWVDSTSVSGTMTLYFPYDEGERGLTSKRFAELVQGEILKAVNTTDRKIVSRPNLVVLNSTDMPAVLVEMGFLSSPSDRQKLSDDEFKQKAAQGIFTAIIKALSELN